MDKGAIKTFAIESRRQMIESVRYQASLIGITANGVDEPISKAEGMETYDYGFGTHTIFDKDLEKRKSLVDEINNKGFDNVVEEVAYTWFNRIIAIRFMEVNDYLPTRTRVLSSETEGKIEPDIITNALELDLNYAEDDKQLIVKFNEENKLDDLFQFLFIKQCNKLNEILPGLFDNTDDFSELLFNISFTNTGGIVRRLVDEIPEDNFLHQVEIIGWLYQFYNSELKDETFDNIKKGIKINKERIPAATQLFTPDWIVKYMVENSLGKLWLNKKNDVQLKSNWKYYIEGLETFDIDNNLKNKSIEDIMVIDPCMGSGHILVYLFDVLMQIYLSEGYTKEDASVLILENNLFGLDIDDRAYQIAYFALMMKAREINKRIFNKNISPQLCSIQESNTISNTFVSKLISINPSIKSDLEYLVDKFKNAKIYGSILKVKQINFNEIKNVLNNLPATDLFYLRYNEEIQLLFSLIKQGEFLYNSYDVVVTNPPYMGNKSMDSGLKSFLKSNYPSSKNDLFSVFIERSFSLSTYNGYIGLLTPYVWMFLPSFEKLRWQLINNKSITSLVQLEYNAFPEACVPVCCFTFKNNKINIMGEYIKLSDFKGVDIQEDKTLEAIQDYDCDFRYHVDSNMFSNIPRNPIAFWIDKNLVNSFTHDNLIKFSHIKQGLATADNNRFLRFWYEVNLNKIGFSFNSCEDSELSGFKWFPFNKGGSFRRWYGNQEYVINFEKNGFELKNFEKANFSNPKFQFNESISWSRISNSKISFRDFPKGFLFDSAACSIFLNQSINKYYILGLLNSNVSQYILGFIAPTLNYQAGDIALIPVIFSKDHEEIINDLVKNNVEIANNDWNDLELSWNFKKHPLLDTSFTNIRDSFNKYKNIKEEQFNTMKNNEIYLNEIFNEIYSLDIDSSVNDMHISVTKADHTKDIKSLISYVVGLMFGRYNIENEGIQFAGGNFNLEMYNKFIPDNDNIIPVLDTEYFNDDIVGRFVEFIKIYFGEENLEENLDFIAGALKKKGKTSREIIRNYFLTDFFKDHVKMYKKRPIYWQFDSGKQNAFKCLIYVHRYEPNTVARVRTDYLHKTQKAIEQNLAHCDKIIANSSNKSEVSKATKDKSKYIKQLDEIKVYDEALGHIANQHIEIDLDDGVKDNYVKFQNVEIAKEGEKVKKINLLKKI